MDTMQATLDLARRAQLRIRQFLRHHGLSRLGVICPRLEQGCRYRRAWTGYAQHARDCLPLPTRHLTAREVLHFRDEAFTRYYTDPGYLNMIENRFGGDTVAHLRKMSSVPLEARFAEWSNEWGRRKTHSPMSCTSCVTKPFAMTGRDHRIRFHDVTGQS